MLGADNLQTSLPFGLIGVAREKGEGLVIAELCAVHPVVKDGVCNGAEIKLELVEAESEVTVTIALIQHHLFGIDGPTLNIGSVSEHASKNSA